jgi:hypothetical protein
MLKRLFLVTSFIAIVSVGAAFKYTPAEDAFAPIPDSFSEFDMDRKITNGAFQVGESLKFIIRVGPISAGNAFMEILEVVTHNNRRCYRVVSRAESNNFFSAFYKVRDKATSLIDSVGIYPWDFQKQTREGKYRADVKLIFDQTNNRIITKKDTVETPPYVQDVLSSFYYLRTQELEVGKSYSIDYFSEKKLYPLEVKILRRETVRVRAGKFACLVVEPVLKSAGIFKHKGRITVWLTDDQRKMPVLMKSQIVVGSIVAELTGYEGVVAADPLAERR